MSTVNWYWLQDEILRTALTTLTKFPFRPQPLATYDDTKLLWKRADITEIRQINHGMAWSLYFQDPEGNRIELFTNSPWHVEQPIADQLDLDLPDQTILNTTKENYCNHADFQDRLEWHENLSDLLSH